MLVNLGLMFFILFFFLNLPSLSKDPEVTFIILSLSVTVSHDLTEFVLFNDDEQCRVEMLSILIK